MECMIKDLPVHYETRGEGRPMLMLHGWSVDHHWAMAEMEPLFTRRDGWKRIYPDLPGHGQTPGRDWITNQDDILQVILDLIDATLPGQKFAVAGTSLGAYLARGVVRSRPASITGVLLNVPVIHAEGARRHVPAPVVLVEDAALAAGLEPALAELFPLVVVQDRKVIEILGANLPPAGVTGDLAFQARIQENPAAYAFTFDVDPLPAPCPAPALILAGRQDFIAGYRDAWGILDDYPRGTFAVLDRAGHLLEAEQQDLFHALAEEWLDRVEEFLQASP